VAVLSLPKFGGLSFLLFFLGGGSSKIDLSKIISFPGDFCGAIPPGSMQEPFVRTLIVPASKVTIVVFGWSRAWLL